MSCHDVCQLVVYALGCVFLLSPVFIHRYYIGPKVVKARADNGEVLKTCLCGDCLTAGILGLFSSSTLAVHCGNLMRVVGTLIFVWTVENVRMFHHSLEWVPIAQWFTFWTLLPMLPFYCDYFCECARSNCSVIPTIQLVPSLQRFSDSTKHLIDDTRSHLYAWPNKSVSIFYLIHWVLLLHFVVACLQTNPVSADERIQC